jgi:two-component system cell cycle sensor histidine kinase/response regulator CckA
MKYKLQDLIDIAHFQNLQDRLNEIYSFPSAIIDNDGKVLTATGWQDVCTQFHRKNHDCLQECIASDRYIQSHLHEANPAVSYRCPHGLVDNATPIIIEGVHYGNFFTGQFFLEKPDLEFFRAQARKYGFAEEAYLEAVKRVPIWSKEQLNSYLFFIKGLIAIISESGLKRLREVEIREKIEASEEDRRTILQTAMDGFWLTDTEGRLLDVNETYCRMSGYTAPELLTMHITDLDARETADDTARHIQKVITQGEDRFESRHRRKDGSEFDVEVSALFHPGRGGRFVIFLRDISARKRADEKIRQLAREHRIIIENANIGIILIRDRKQLWLNDKTAEIFGYPREALVGQTTRLYYPSQEAYEKLGNEAYLVLGQGQLYETVQELIRSDGAHIRVRYNGKAIDPTDMSQGAIWLLEDITERLLKEDALRDSEEKFRQLAENIADVFWITSPDFKVMHYASPAYERIWGRSVANLYAKPQQWEEAILPEDRAGVLAALAELSRNAPTVGIKYRIKRPDGSLRWIFDQAYQVRDAAGKVIRIAGITSDITERKQSEEQNDLLQQTINGHRDSAYWLDAHSRIVYVNDTACRMLGYAREELVGSQVGLINPRATPERLQEVWAKIRAERHLLAETVHRRKDGTEFPVEIMSTFIEVSGNEFICGFAQDITGRKSIEAQLLQAQRMEAVGTLASGIAHDLNNILAPMLMVSGLLKDRLPDEQDQEMLGMLQNEARRGGEIIKQLLTYSRGLAVQRIVVQPRYCFKELIAMLRETFPREIDLRLQLAGDLWPIFADPTQLHQLAMNLCVNARDAMPRGGHLTIGAANVYLPAGNVALPASAQPGRYVLIEIADSGHGIPPEIRDQIFDPFFTTKAIGKGTGLGLSTVLGIARSHGGFVTVDSTPGQGSVFRVYLPAQPGAGTADTSAPVQAPQAGEGQLILVVDDERNIRESTRIALQRHGFRVEMAVNGEDALVQYRRNRQKIRLVVTDVMMPVMGGVALVRQLRELNSKLPIVITSGLTDETSRAELAELDVAEFVLKPLDVSSLLAAVQRGLSDPVVRNDR